jgi:exopolysaccharide biosynthesis protein
MLVADGQVVVDDDREGFSAGAGQFDSDITAELARLLVSLGATDAINLDGGGSTTLVHHGHLLNRPYSSVDQPGPESARW